MELSLSEEERRLVLGIVERTLSDLRVEVRRTETPDYHDRLKQEQRVLERLLARLARGPSA